jgi:hypothetical protein
MSAAIQTLSLEGQSTDDMLEDEDDTGIPQVRQTAGLLVSFRVSSSHPLG